VPTTNRAMAIVQEHRDQIRGTKRRIGVPGYSLTPVVGGPRSSPVRWVWFIRNFGLPVADPRVSRSPFRFASIILFSSKR
jgi:hypothetical protein